jgi:hypothetical protein
MTHTYQRRRSRKKLIGKLCHWGRLDRRRQVVFVMVPQEIKAKEGDVFTVKVDSCQCLRNSRRDA